MVTTATFARLAALAGDPARAGMLAALMDGRALTASELARVSGVTAQTASSHLARLTDAGMLAVEKQGRHRYHRLATPAVAAMVESIMQLAAETSARSPPRVGPRDADLRAARTCYDHLAGRLGVRVTQIMQQRSEIELNADGGLLTQSGAALMRKLGLTQTIGDSRRVLCRPCLDWSERRHHLAGAVGAALYAHFLDRKWLRRQDGTRALAITRVGEREFEAWFRGALD